LAYLIEENRSLRGYVRGRIRLTDEEHRRLAMRVTGWAVAACATSPPIVTPEHYSPLASAAHRAEMDVREATGRSSGRARREPALGGGMAEENPT
jgi:hypothetical protein